jgi:cytochrome P450
VAGAGEFDLIEDFAEPLPVAVIAELLGVPEVDRQLLRPWSQAIVKMYEFGRTPRVEADAIAASGEFADYMRDLATRRRAEPRDDLVSHLALAEERGHMLSEDELVASAILLLNAGHEASVNVFGNGLVAMLQRELAPGADVAATVEEMLRFDSALQLFERTATEDVALGDVVVAAGERIAVLLGAANRDPAVFDAPDEFQVDRTPNNHVAFGVGVHFCLGAPLARMELVESLGALWAACPSLTLAGEPESRGTFVLRGFRRVPVGGGS